MKNFLTLLLFFGVVGFALAARNVTDKKVNARLFKIEYNLSPTPSPEFYQYDANIEKTVNTDGIITTEFTTMERFRIPANIAESPSLMRNLFSTYSGPRPTPTMVLFRVTPTPGE